MKRNLTLEEEQILLKLLENDFPGSTELRVQAKLLTSTSSEQTLSIRLHPVIGTPAMVENRVPVEASFVVKNRINDPNLRGHILLHVVDGYLNDLEIYSESGEPILKFPEIDDLTIEVFTPAT